MLTGQGGITVKTNIFMKSILRQPVRTLFMAVLIGVAAFAFVARAAEFVVVRGEIRRVEGLFPSIGVLTPIDPQDFTVDHDVTHAAEIIAASPHLAFEDRRVFAQGVLHDRRNIVSHVIRNQVEIMVPFMEHLDIKVMDQYFYGVVRNEPQLVRMGDMYFFQLRIEVDGHIVGDPRALRKETQVFTNEQGQTATLSAVEIFFLPLTAQEAELYRQGLFDPLCGVVVGGRYVFRGVVWNLFTRFLRPLGGEDGLRFVERPLPGGMYGTTFFELAIVDDLRGDDLIFTVDASDRSVVDEALASIQDDIYLADMNLSSVTVVGTKDMTTIPRFTNPRHAQLTRVYGGRWLNYDDHINANPVALIPGSLAVRSNLRVGETFTITLRNNPRPGWIDRETNSRWSMGIEGWWESAYRGWWGLSSGDDWRYAETYELELEVVGVYWFFPPDGHYDNFSDNEIFIPASLIPEGFGWEGMPLLTGMYSFNLTSARHEAAFLRANSAAIEALGFNVGFLASDFFIFDAAMAPTRASIAINLAVFSAVSVLLFVLVIFLYLRQWSRALAIVRALGQPTNAAMRHFFAPVFCIWVPAIAVGAVAGWFFSLAQAESTLVAAMGEAYIDPSIGLFIALAGGMVLLVVAGVISSGYRVASRPVLEQIQGTVQKVRRVKALPDTGSVPEFVKPTVGFPMSMPLKTTPGAAFRAGYRHMLRRIWRSPVKSLLATVLALFFVISLGWMNHTIHFTEAEIDRFMDTTVIAADLVRSAGETYLITPGFESAYIGQVAVDTMLYSGFVQGAYLEAVWRWGGFYSYFEEEAMYISTSFLGVSCIDGFVAENTRTPFDDQLGVLGDSMEIEFIPGFNSDDFGFTPGSPMPLVVRQSAMDSLGLALGDIIGLYDTATTGIGVAAEGIPIHLVYGEVVGYFTGGLDRAIDIHNQPISLVMPRDFLRYKFQEYSLYIILDGWDRIGILAYATARFYIDPARNRELDRLPDLVYAQISPNMLGRLVRPVPLELLIHDDIIQMVVEPMERNLALLRTLYPISIVVAIVLGFGMSLLTMLTGIKNAAIMRVLGLSRPKTLLSLWGEQVMVCVSGVAISLVTLHVIGVGVSMTPVMLAGMYMAGAALGGVLGALIISARSPLELLQVKE